jgi:hypothetical protein
VALPVMLLFIACPVEALRSGSIFASSHNGSRSSPLSGDNVSRPRPVSQLGEREREYLNARRDMFR